MSFLSLLVLSREKASVEEMMEREKSANLPNSYFPYSYFSSWKVPKQWNYEPYQKVYFEELFGRLFSSNNMHFKPPKMMLFEASL